MKITFNPSTVAALTTPPNNKDITFDLRGRNIFARGVKFYGTDTNTWRDIKINNVSIGSHTLDLQNGSNTTLTNTNGVVTINSTWRPVVDNLTSDSTTSSLSAKQGKVLKALIDGKSNSDHNHDGRYVRYYAVTTLDCNNLAAGLTAARISATNAAHTNHSAYLYISDVETPFQIQIPDSSIPYIYKRYYGSGKWSGWFKLNAGYADSAGSVAWANVTGKPSSYTPSAHTHAWNSLTHSSTTENQAILTNGEANGWKLQTLNIARWDNAANNAHSHANKSVLDGITSALVNSWNTAYNFVSNITGTDTDKVINKWEEIVNFLAGITEDNKLNTLLNSKLSVYELANNTNVGTIKNNGIYYSTTDASSGTLINSPFNTGFAFINMTSYNEGDDLRRSRLAFNAFGEIKVSDDRDQTNTAETWYNVLTSKNSGINGSTIKLNGTSITVYSSGTADGRYVKKSGDTMQGVLTIDTTNFGALTIKRNDDANGATIQFRGKSSVYGYIGLNNSAKDKQFLRWSSDTSRIYTILDTSSTYVSNNKGYINGTEITQVNNSDKVDNRHAISTTPNTGIIYKAAIYTNYSLTSYWVRLASIPSIVQNGEFVATIHVQSGHSNPGRSAILLVYLRGNASSFMAKSFKICCNSNYDPNRFRLYYKDSDKTSEIWYQTTGWYDGIITTVISQSAEGQLYEGLTLYSGSITAVQTPSMSTYLSAQVSTITDNISGNASTATKLQTARSIWGQSFDGTGNVSGFMKNVKGLIYGDSLDEDWSDGNNTHPWYGIDYRHCVDSTEIGKAYTSISSYFGLYFKTGGWRFIFDGGNVGIGTSTPAYKLDVRGDIYSSGYVRASSGFIKGSSSDSYVLLGGGGHKLESSLNAAYSKYLKGITLTGGDSNNAGYRLIFEKTMGAWDINYGVWAIAFRHSGRGTLNIGFDTTNSDGSTYTYNIRFLGSTASRESTPFRAFYNSTTKVFRIYWHYYDFTSGDIAVLRGNMEPHNGTWMASLPNDVGTELAITCNMADQAANADTVDGYHATDGRTFNGNIHWGSWNNVWSDGTHTHPWYGFDHRYPNTGVYSTTISDYSGMTIKTYNTLLLDCGTLLLNSRNNVGIGTTSPTQKLDVIGNIRATGQIIREGRSDRWVGGRNVALLRETSAVGYHTLWSLKTTNGSWDFGEYNAESDWTNIPVLSYITDSNYNSGNNAITYQIKFPLASGTVALTSNIPNPTNHYWANVKISASSSTTTSPTFSNVYLGNSLYLNNRGSNSIYNGPNDSANGVGGPLNNLVFSSWQGVSFTTSCAGLTYTKKNAVSINCRTGQLYAREVQANGFIHTSHNNNDAVLLAGGDYKTLESIWGGDPTHYVFLGYLTLYNGNDGTISGSFICSGYSVPFTYTRGGSYCYINIPDTSFQTFYIEAAIASVHYSGAGMGDWVGNHRGDGAWWLHCYAVGSNAVQVKGFRSANGHNDSWWGGNPLFSGNGAAKKITVCLFGYVTYK